MVDPKGDEKCALLILVGGGGGMGRGVEYQQVSIGIATRVRAGRAIGKARTQTRSL